MTYTLREVIGEVDSDSLERFLSNPKFAERG